MTVCVDRMRESDLVALALFDEATRPDEAQLRAEMLRPWARIWVGRGTDGIAIGFLVAWQVADELQILNVATRIDRRRRGVARALMEAALSYARATAARLVLLEVRSSNIPAIALYGALGFVTTGVRARYYPDGEDAVEMALICDPSSDHGAAHADDVRPRD